MTRFFVLALLFTLAGCCGLNGQAEQAARDGIAVNAGHMRDMSLPEEAREVATDNHDYLWDILYYEGCEEKLPDDVRARKNARDARAAAAKAKAGAQ